MVGGPSFRLRPRRNPGGPDLQSRRQPPRHARLRGWPLSAVTRALSAGDERPHRLRLKLDFVEPVLDDVPDADDAAQPAVLDYRAMADPAVPHSPPQLPHP